MAPAASPTGACAHFWVRASTRAREATRCCVHPIPSSARIVALRYLRRIARQAPTNDWTPFLCAATDVDRKMLLREIARYPRADGAASRTAEKPQLERTPAPAAHPPSRSLSQPAASAAAVTTAAPAGGAAGASTVEEFVVLLDMSAAVSNYVSFDVVRAARSARAHACAR